MRTIAVVTVARSDYGIYLPILRRIQIDPELRLQLIVAGAHLSPEFGLTVRAIESDGFQISERVEMLLSSDSPEGTAKSMGLGTIGFAQAFGRLHPDVLLVLGDRFEMHSAVVAAVPFRIIIAHIHGGELTAGAIDESLRHSITKMSHIHFVATETYARRVIQMGESPGRVIVTGAPSIDNLYDMELLSREDIEAKTGLIVRDRTLLVTYHPVTREVEDTAKQMQALLAAIEASDCPVIFTYPGADMHSRSLIEMIRDFSGHYPKTQIAKNLGTQLYFSLMSQVAAMVGNSSSGIIEAASFKLPVINIGSRQLGRVIARNVLNVNYDQSEILAAIKRGISDEFRNSLADLQNPYGDGKAAQRIVRHLLELGLKKKLLFKPFYDLTVEIPDSITKQK